VDTVHECDRQTDRQTDRITITKTVQRDARRTVKIGVILLNKQETGDGKYSKILNNCARFESNTEVTIRFDSKFRLFAQH